jgi:sugar lactone lactonase YvrE
MNSIQSLGLCRCSPISAADFCRFALGLVVVAAAYAAPPNDNFATAAIVSGSTFRITDTNTGATTETSEPHHAGNTGGASVWWRWTAPASTAVSLDTWSSSFDTVVAVYTGSSVGALTPIASDHNSGGPNVSALSFSAAAGTTYFIAVDGFGGARGSVVLHLDATVLEVTTFAGATGSPGSIDGTATAARFAGSHGVAVDAAGNVFVTDASSNTIRKITPAGDVSTLAGSAGMAGSTNGTGAAARFDWPWGVAVDSAGNVYVSEWNNHTIRKITPAGEVSTLAGLARSSGSSDGTGAAARFFRPLSVAVDRAGNVHVADQGNHTIRKITPTGVVTTLAGSPGIEGSSDGTASAARFSSPHGLAFDAADNLYVADNGNQTIRRITASGVVSTVAGSVGIRGSADGIGAAARFNSPIGMTVDPAGTTLYVADNRNQTIRKISPGGVVTTRAGSVGVEGVENGTGTDARFRFPDNLAVSRDGVVFFADAASSTIRKGTPVAAPTTTSSRLLNLSTRGLCLTGGDVLIPGFVVSGSANKRLLARVVGPSLGDFGVAGVLANPTMTLKRLVNGAFVDHASNDNWGTNANATEIVTTSNAAGAFPLNVGSADAALLVDLPAGTYTVVASGVGNTTGVSLVELYDVDASVNGSRLVNISTRSFVGTGGDIMIPGYVISSGGPRTLLVRAVGPSLASLGVSGALADSQLAIRRRETDGADSLIATNDDWSSAPGAANTNAVAARVGAFALPFGSKDAALVVTLQPGVYTVQASGVGATTGTALVEVYEVP